MAKWLTHIIQPVLANPSDICVPDSRTFANQLRNSSNCSFLCSFDIRSLFTNVLFDEAVCNCGDALYDGVRSPIPPQFPRNRTRLSA